MVTSMQQPQQDKEADSSVTFDNFTAMETSVQRHSSDEFVPNLSSTQITCILWPVTLQTLHSKLLSHLQQHR